MKPILKLIEDNSVFLAGSYVVSDPCYVWDQSDNEYWHELCGVIRSKMTNDRISAPMISEEPYLNKEGELDDSGKYQWIIAQRVASEKFYADLPEPDGYCIVSADNQPCFIGHTAYGDGVYSLKYKGKNVASLGVDAGLLSLIPIELVKSWGNLEKAKRLGHIITMDKSFKVKYNNGDFSWPNYRIKTS